jgi:hypothetical protein
MRHKSVPSGPVDLLMRWDFNFVTQRYFAGSGPSCCPVQREKIVFMKFCLIHAFLIFFFGAESDAFSVGRILYLQEGERQWQW